MEITQEEMLMTIAKQAMVIQRLENIVNSLQAQIPKPEPPEEEEETDSV